MEINPTLVIAPALPLVYEEWSWLLINFQLNIIILLAQSFLLSYFIDFERFLIFMGVQ